MTDQTRDRRPPGSPLDELDWDDALADWERELEREGAVAPRAAPMPQRPAEVPAGPSAPRSGSRPLYRPDPSLLARRPVKEPSGSATATAVDLGDVEVDLHLDVEAVEGKEASSSAGRPAAPHRVGPTASPGPPTPPAGLDLDALLADVEAATDPPTAPSRGERQASGPLGAHASLPRPDATHKGPSDRAIGALAALRSARAQRAMGARHEAEPLPAGKPTEVGLEPERREQGHGDAAAIPSPTTAAASVLAAATVGGGPVQVRETTPSPVTRAASEGGPMPSEHLRASAADGAVAAVAPRGSGALARPAARGAAPRQSAHDVQGEAMRAGATSGTSAARAAPDAPHGGPAPVDRGAAAAARTVQYRKKRPEHYPLVGDAEPVRRARLALLESLARRENLDTAMRARLLHAAAELAEALGESERALELLERACTLDASELAALRALRARALALGRWEQAAHLAQTETTLPVDATDRAAAWLLLAELRRSRLADPDGALDAVRNARREADGVAAVVLHHEIASWLGRRTEAAEALRAGASLTSDPAWRAALLVLGWVEHERAGRIEASEALAAATADGAPEDPLVRWTAARLALAVPSPHGAATQLLAAAQSLRGEPRPDGEHAMGEALRRAASRLWLLAANRPREAMDALGDPRTVEGFRALVDAARAAGDRARMGLALDALVRLTHGTERALALVERAETLLESGDDEAAEQLLRDAAAADPNLTTVAVARELLARRTGRALSAAPSGDAAAEAVTASLGRAPVAGVSDERERDLAIRAASEDEAPLLVESILLDIACRLDDREAVAAALRRAAEHADASKRLGALLALAETAAGMGRIDEARAALEEARHAARGHPLVCRPLSRLLLVDDPRAAAELWLEEASTAPAGRAAFALCSAARLLEQAGETALDAWRRALDAVPAHEPARWAMCEAARRAGDAATLALLHESAATHAPDVVSQAREAFRAALACMAHDPQAALVWLERARADASDDLVLADLARRLEPAPERKAQMLLEIGRRAGPTLAPALRLAAARELVAAGRRAQAAELCREILRERPNDVLVDAWLERLELDAGEHARVAERWLARLRAVPDGAARRGLLQRLADLDVWERADTAGAVLSLQAVLEVDPGHMPSLRALERLAMDAGRDDDLAGIEESLARHVAPGPDVAAHARLAVRLRLAPESAAGSAGDEALAIAAERGLDAWTARRAAAAPLGVELQSRAVEYLHETAREATDRATYALRLAELGARSSDPSRALRWLRRACEHVPAHPVAAEKLARALDAAGAAAEAAEAYEAAAASARVPTHVAALRYAAGRIWQDRVGDRDRAIGALSSVVQLDPAHLDAFDRLRALLAETQQDARLADVLAARIAAGGDPASLARWHAELATLHERLGRTEAARESLRALLTLEPDRPAELRKLAELSLLDEDWRGAAEALIRVARLSKDRDELRWCFFHLGDIYDRRIPDVRRAEAAFQRVLKLRPDDVEAMERLARLYRRTGATAQAVQMLEALVHTELDPDRSRTHSLELAATYEPTDPRRAEAVLEQTRRRAPTDLTVLRAIAEFYERQHAQPALFMHLNRAVADFRHAIETDPTDAAAWHGLVEVLGWRGRRDAARVCASAAATLGITDVSLSQWLDARGGVPGLASVAADPDVDDGIAPALLGRVTRRVFEQADSALDAVLPFDARALRAERLPRGGPLADAIAEASRWLGLAEVQVLVTAQRPRVMLGVSSQPPTLLVGRELLGALDPHESVFLVTRALKLAQAHLTAAVRTPPEALSTVLVALVRLFDPTIATAGHDPAALDDAARRLGKALSRRTRDELAPLVLEMTGLPGFDPKRLGAAALELADRSALLATGALPAAVGGLLRLAGEDVAPTGPRARLEAIRRVPEAWALLTFAISETHLDLRARAGAERL
ncbi:MAG: hypothetical protein NZ898_02970 [Myxococcota bacterium]|nr:hypothetical protein [Myxococcota bacterium]